MKPLISYIFWKNVYHNYWLYFLTWLYYFIFIKRFRNEVRLNWSCMLVENQDEWRVKWAELSKHIGEIYIIMNSLLTDIKQIKNDHETNNKR